MAHVLEIEGKRKSVSPLCHKVHVSLEAANYKVSFLWHLL